MNEHIAVVDLGYGDAGKGSVVDALCAHSPRTAVLRFNGGAQAAQRPDRAVHDQGGDSVQSAEDGPHV